MHTYKYSWSHHIIGGHLCKLNTYKSRILNIRINLTLQVRRDFSGDVLSRIVPRSYLTFPTVKFYVN